MRFEQAFYTRGKNLLNREEGLGIAAASNLEPQFLAECQDIGSNFKAENSGETAEFVIYSQDRESFVGIEVNPANSEGMGGRSILCHCFLPMEVSDEPEDYYLDYPFKRQIEKELEKIEVHPCLKKKDFTKKLNQYGFEKEKLAEFLASFYPVLMKEQMELFIVLDSEKYKKEDCFRIAREITWLASYLVPAIEEEEIQSYRKLLSYGANSKENLLSKDLNIRLGFLMDDSMDESLSENRFYLDKTERKEVSECYQELAKRACSSYREFWKFLEKLYEEPLEKEPSIRDLHLRYLRWKCKQGEKIKWEEVSEYINYIRKEARYEKVYQEWLSQCLPSIEDIPMEALGGIWKHTIEAIPKEKDAEAGDSFFVLTAEVLESIYAKEKERYKICLKNLPSEVQKEVIEQLYEKEHSCVQKEIKQAASVLEYEEMFTLYDGLCDNVKFLTQIAEGCVEKCEQESDEAKLEANISWIEAYLETYEKQLETVEEYKKWKKRYENLKEKKELQQERDALHQERDALKQERDVLQQERDVLQQEKDALQQERDVLQQEKDALKQERDVLKQERDALQQEKDALKQERDVLQQERDVLQQERDASKQEKEYLKQENAKLKVLEQKNAKLQQERDVLKQQNSALQKRPEIDKRWSSGMEKTSKSNLLTVKEQDRRWSDEMGKTSKSSWTTVKDQDRRWSSGMEKTSKSNPITTKDQDKRWSSEMEKTLKSNPTTTKDQNKIWQSEIEKALKSNEMISKKEKTLDSLKKDENDDYSGI